MLMPILELENSLKWKSMIITPLILKNWCCPHPSESSQSRHHPRPPQDGGAPKERGNWNWAGLQGTFLVTRPLCVPLLIVYRKSFSLLGLPGISKSRFEQLMIRIITGLLDPPEEIQITIWCISLTCSAETIPHPDPGGGWWLYSDHKL